MTWLTARLGNFILAGLLVTISAAALVDGIRNRSEIATLNRIIDQTAKAQSATSESLGICQANYRTIELALDRQSDRIRLLSEASQAATDEAAKQLAAIAKDGKAAREASQRVLALPRPAPEMACAAAARLLRGGM